MPRASERLCKSLFFIQPYFTAASSCCSLHTDLHEHNGQSVYKQSSSQSAVFFCHTDFVLNLAAWSMWLRVPSWAPCFKSEVKCRVFFFLPISCIIYLKLYVLNSGSFYYFLFLDKGTSRKSTCVCCSVCLRHTGKWVLCVLLVGIKIVMNHW